MIFSRVFGGGILLVLFAILTKYYFGCFCCMRCSTQTHIICRTNTHRSTDQPPNILKPNTCDNNFPFGYVEDIQFISLFRLLTRSTRFQFMGMCVLFVVIYATKNEREKKTFFFLGRAISGFVGNVVSILPDLSRYCVLSTNKSFPYFTSNTHTAEREKK